MRLSGSVGDSQSSLLTFLPVRFYRSDAGLVGRILDAFVLAKRVK